MPEMDYIAEDWDFPFLIKTMKKKYLERTLKEGLLCFNTPSTFIAGEGLSSAQQDKYEAHLSFEARHIMVAPILYEDENGPHYGTAQNLADRAQAHFTTDEAKRIPLCSFRYVASSELVEKYGAYFFRLGDVVDRISKEFQHDAYILIYAPQVFGHRIFQKESCFSYKVHYGDIDEKFGKFISQAGYSTASLLQKSPSYQWQQEFRIILEPKKDEGKYFVNIGSIEDVAFGGDLEQLRNGFIFCQSNEQLKEINHVLARDKITLDNIFETQS